jgi:hypothetical protein
VKRYLLFSGDTYYPSGGWQDFVDSFDTQEEADARGRIERSNGHDWYHVVDAQTGNRVTGAGVGEG